MTVAFGWRRMLAFPNEGGSPGRPARLQWAALPAETTHGTSFTSEYYTQKTRMPRSCPGSVSERFSLQRLRPLFSALPTLGRALLPCALSRAKPLVRLVLGLAAVVAPVLFPMLWDGWPRGGFQEHPRVLWEGLANKCSCVRWPGRVTAAWWLGCLWGFRHKF